MWGPVYVRHKTFMVAKSWRLKYAVLNKGRMHIYESVAALRLVRLASRGFSSSLSLSLASSPLTSLPIPIAAALVDRSHTERGA